MQLIFNAYFIKTVTTIRNYNKKRNPILTYPSYTLTTPPTPSLSFRSHAVAPQHRGQNETTRAN